MLRQLVHLGLVVDVGLASFYKGSVGKVNPSLIITTVQNLSPTQCQLKCKVMKDCSSIAFDSPSLKLGAKGECKLLKEKTSNAKPQKEEIQLFTINKVSFVIFNRGNGLR